MLGRVLLHKPDWIIYDESIAELDDENRKVALSIFSSELAHTAIVCVGRMVPDSNHFFHRTLHLQSKLPGLKLPLHLNDPPDTDDFNLGGGIAAELAVAKTLAMAELSANDRGRNE